VQEFQVVVPNQDIQFRDQMCYQKIQLEAILRCPVLLDSSESILMTAWKAKTVKLSESLFYTERYYNIITFNI
jgi:hypothetical protein